MQATSSSHARIQRIVNHVSPEFDCMSSSVECSETSGSLSSAGSSPTNALPDPLPSLHHPQIDRFARETVSDRDVFIVSFARTPLGSFNGALASLSAIELGKIAAQGAISRGGVDPSAIQEVFFGNVVSANLGQAPAKQVALGVGCSDEVICTTVNKVCASGMKCIMLGSMSIQCGLRDVVLVGGMESMSNTPYYSPSTRFGAKYGSVQLIDGVEHDGLSDPYERCSMGEFAERLADRAPYSRSDQDAYATESYRRAMESIENGAFRREIVPVRVSMGRKDVVVDCDEEPSRGDPKKFSSLRTPFRRNGTVTAATSSPISDGAAALLLVSGAFLRSNPDVTPIAQILGYDDASQAPELFTTSPVIAAPRALARANASISDVDFWEINEAFAVVALAFIDGLGLDPSRVNPFGGAVALGHPIGCSGARIVGTLLNAMLSHPDQLTSGIGCASICNGGGGASALVVRVFSSSSG